MQIDKPRQTKARIYYLAAVFAFLLSASAHAQKQKTISVYTTLADTKCKTLELNVEESGYYRGQCWGTAGYKLEVIEGDLRQTVNVIAPNKKKFELNLWTTVSSAFSALGDKAEWRVVTKKGKATPVALIVRFNASENPDNPNQMTSYLVVSKITAKEVCITDIIKPKLNANTEAQKLADDSAGKPCKIFDR